MTNTVIIQMVIVYLISEITWMTGRTEPVDKATGELSIDPTPAIITHTVHNTPFLRILELLYLDVFWRERERERERDHYSEISLV